jgi:hypothetical protein
VSLLHFQQKIKKNPTVFFSLYYMTKCSYGYDIYYDQSLYSVILWPSVAMDMTSTMTSLFILLYYDQV